MELPYGSWPSPITAAEVASSSPRIDGALFVGEEIWWGESVPAERGRVTVRRRDVDGGVHEVLPGPWSARSRVHEYGGGAWTATPGGVLFFVNGEDQRVYRSEGGGGPVPLTPAGARYGGLRWQRGMLLAVEERVEADPHAAPRRAIVAIPADGAAAADPAAVRILAGGSDFLAHPALSPDGTRLAWVAWDHPDMPWDRARLRIAVLDPAPVPSGASSSAAPAFVEIETRAALQPEWTGPDELTYADDSALGASPDGRWNLRRIRLEGIAPAGPPEPVAPADADTGGGLWVLGQRWYQPLADGRIVAVQTNGTDETVLIDPAAPDAGARTLDLPLVTRVSVEDAQGSRVLLTGSGPVTAPGLWLLDVDGATPVASAEEIRPDEAQDHGTSPHPGESPRPGMPPTGPGATAADLLPGGTEADERRDSPGSAATPIRGGEAVDPAWSPRARAITVEGPHGPVHAFDYPPTHPGATAPPGERPPYVVWVHGGPTDHVAGAASSAVAFFTSRGIGVLDVNYGGSSGYGRAYRERLSGEWGVADVDDVLAAARGLAEADRADPDRLAIRGGSAGGWTVLCALVRGGVFAAGVSRYGIGDLRALAADTHDFEKHYTDRLVGPLPEAEEVYLARSPLTHADRIDVPVLLLQGGEDAVVPPAQSEAIRDALISRGVPCDYVLFPEEGHGFRRAETVVAALEAEFAFLARTFGFVPAGGHGVLGGTAPGTS